MPVERTVRRRENYEDGIGWDSWIFLKWTVTDARSIACIVEELWISWLSLFNLIQFALYPNINNILSIKLDFPEPFGPTTLVKFS